MQVLSDEYGFVGLMRIGHVMRPLREDLHQRGDLSLLKSRELIEYGYALYVQQYAARLEQLNQDLLEEEYQE